MCIHAYPLLHPRCGSRRSLWKTNPPERLPHGRSSFEDTTPGDGDHSIITVVIIAIIISVCMHICIHDIIMIMIMIILMMIKQTIICWIRRQVSALAAASERQRLSQRGVSFSRTPGPDTHDIYIYIYMCIYIYICWSSSVARKYHTEVVGFTLGT